MRDPDRIARVLDLLSKYWEKNPDMRLAQIVGNCHGWHRFMGNDPYYMEDDRLENYLRWELDR